MQTSSILNLNNTGWKTGKYPLFLGEELGLHDSINRPYPELFDLFKKLKSLDWSEDEVNLAQARMDFETCDQVSYDVMIKTLSWQYEADSIASRSIVTLFAPFVSNNELSQMLIQWSGSEALHALTYAEIIRQCIPDPNQVFEDIHNNTNITDRSNKIVEGFLALKKAGAQYTLDKDSLTQRQLREVILKAIVSLYCLEAMEFMASFACTFALAQRELFLPVADLVQKIMIDETIHAEMDVAIFDILLKDSLWAETYEDIKDDIQEIVDSIYQQELSWSDYIFSEGRSVVGLTTPLLKEWVQYRSQDVYSKLKLNRPYNKVESNPLVWMDEWLDIDSTQKAAQESDITNYRLNSVIRDEKVDYTFDFGIDRDTKPEPYTVYTKDNCPYCVKLKEFLLVQDLSFEEVKVDSTIKRSLNKIGLSTVPQVFDQQGNYKGDCTSFINTYSK